MIISPKKSPFSPKKTLRSPARSPFSPRKTKTIPHGYTPVICFTKSDIQEIPRIPNSELYIELQLIGTNLTNFKGMRTMPNLEILRIDNSKIETFLGAEPQPKLKTFSIKGSPLSLYDHVAIMARIVFGDQIELVGSRPITTKERITSNKLADLLYDWLTDGWLLTSLTPVRLYNPVTQERKILFTPDDFTPIPLSTDPVSDITPKILTFSDDEDQNEEDEVDHDYVGA